MLSAKLIIDNKIPETKGRLHQSANISQKNSRARHPNKISRQPTLPLEVVSKSKDTLADKIHRIARG